MKNDKDLTEKVIGCAIEVHRCLGPGLLESVYEHCLAFELADANIQHETQKEIKVSYKGILLDCGYRADLIVENKLIVELKAVDKIMPIHEAQLLTYMKLAGINLGLLMNFNLTLLKDGIKRYVL
jgi:GxxExxY protein